jgi:pimeloyl-ACP methyl ester carboxylesterase
MRTVRLFVIVFCLLFFAMSSVAAQPRDLVQRLQDLNATVCETNTTFLCVTLTVPLDHFNPDNPATLDVTFAVRPTFNSRSNKLFVYATGGPGASGLEQMRFRTNWFPPQVLQEHDIVFFDYRGIGKSGGLTCNITLAHFIPLNITDAEAASEASQSFVTDCLAEIEDTSTLPYMSTHQSVEDLRFFWEAIGSPPLYLYGESYGTWFAQTYLEMYPEDVAGAILDSVVDPTLAISDLNREQLEGFQIVARTVLEECNAIENCAEDFDGNALTFYEDLLAELETSAGVVDFPLPEGGTRTETLTRYHIEQIGGSLLPFSYTRTLWLRALASAANGDLRPLVRLKYQVFNTDPQTDEFKPRPDYSAAYYYTIACSSWYVPGETVDEQITNLVNSLNQIESDWFLTNYYGDFTCPYWQTALPEIEIPPLPAPLVAEDVPVLVITASVDPSTPPAMSDRVFPNLADGYRILIEGGQHDNFASGSACVDEYVVDFLRNNALTEREVSCEAPIFPVYIPFTPRTMAEYENPLQMMMAIDAELEWMPEYAYWDGLEPFQVGCPFGGYVTYDFSPSQFQHTFEDCAFIQGFIISGEGRWIGDQLRINATITGAAEGEIEFRASSIRTDEIIRRVGRLEGTYNGETIDLAQS